MWYYVLLFLGLASALNLEYLDPTKLQTISTPKTQLEAALDIIERYSTKVTVTVDHQFREHQDVFHLKTVNDVLEITASTGVAAVWGFNYYLKKYCKSQIEWQTKNVNIPYTWPEVDEIVVANDRFRYYQNVCTAAYSFAWFDVRDWKEHLEWMALNGINLALAPVDQEGAWSRVYKKIGMTQEEIDQHFTGPAFLPWLRMGNVHGWAGPLPQSWHELQEVIEIVVTQSMINLGIVPILPTFSGHVPNAFARLFPNSTFLPVNRWNNFNDHYCCALFLDPNDPQFKIIGKMFLNELTSIPKAHIYTADPFNEVEVKDFSTALVQDTAQNIFATLKEFDDKAVWLLQNWMFVNEPINWPKYRVQTFLTSVPNGRMLILDLQSEQWPQHDLYEMYFGQPFIWCMLHNFGGTLGMFGNMVTINKNVYEVRYRANSTMIGTGLTPEGINQNYVVYDLMLESAWRKKPVDLESWVAEYAERRYGCNSTTEAWKYLLKSVYSFNGLNRVRGKYVVTRRPSFRLKPWAWYRSYDLFQAFKKLVFADRSCHSKGYFYDIADVTRQALQYRAEQLYGNVVSDRYSNTFVFKTSIDQFLDAFSDMGNVLGSSDYFVASKWFDKARKIGKNDDEAYFYEMNAKNQITLWGPNGEISDYACKQWSEVFMYYYRPRWSMFLSAALKAKESNEVFDEKATRRIVTSNVEVPFLNAKIEGFNQFLRSREELLEQCKAVYKKWAYVPLEDLPVIVIKPDPDVMTTMAEVDPESNETPDLPTVIMKSTTPVI